MKTMKMILAAGMTLVLTVAAFAELPPGSYDKMRKEAPEVLIVEVTKITPTKNGKVTKYTTEVKVLSFEKSDSKLKKGDTITITYENVEGPFAGARQVPPLEKGGVYPAFLRKEGNTFIPAAAGMSFSIASE